MRLFVYVVCFSLLLNGCQDPVSASSSPENQTRLVEIPELELNIGEVLFNKMNSRWIHKSDSSLVSGYIVDYYSPDTVAMRFGLVNGEREGVLHAYFPNGERKFLETYKSNKLNGAVQRWTQENGYQLIAHLHYVDGKLHGEQKKWYDTGELHKRTNVSMGKEEGLQQAFRKNGALYANYEARNGRIFGMKRSNLCYELDDEKVVYK